MPTTLSASARLALPANTPFTARRVLRLLQQLRVGVLTIELPDASQHRFGQAHEDHVGSSVPHAHLTLHNWQVFTAALKSGDIGFAESYIAGWWYYRNIQLYGDFLGWNAFIAVLGSRAAPAPPG